MVCTQVSIFILVKEKPSEMQRNSGPLIFRLKQVFFSSCDVFFPVKVLIENVF
jgi:hypothetical protein